MTERPIERVLERWLVDGVDEMPDRVYLSILDRVERQPQRPAWRLRPWRFPSMSTPIKLAAVGAALLAVLLGGAVFLGGGASPGPSATPSPTPSPAPTASPSAVFPSWFTTTELPTGSGILEAGSQTTQVFNPGTSFSVPGGWVNDLDVPIAYGLFPDNKTNEAEFARTGKTPNVIFIVSVESPYFFCEAWEKTVGTAAERAAFLVASDAFAVSEPIDVTIGGLTGKQFDMRVDPDWTTTCPGDPPGSDHRDVRNRVTFLDTPRGVIAIAVGSEHSADHEALLAEAMPIVESFQFELAP